MATYEWKKQVDEPVARLVVGSEARSCLWLLSQALQRHLSFGQSRIMGPGGQVIQTTALMFCGTALAKSLMIRTLSSIHPTPLKTLKAAGYSRGAERAAAPSTAGPTQDPRYKLSDDEPPNY